MEFSIIIASLLANLLTKFAKPHAIGLTDAQKAHRREIIRVANAVFGLVILVATYVFTGGTLDMSELATYTEIIVAGIATFASSQGLYFLAQKR